MRFAAKALVVLSAVSAIAAHAQDPNLNGKIKHVIVVIQENRTPDFLFGSQQAVPGQFFEAGLNLATTGNCLGTTVALQPLPLYTTFDISHSYNPDFVAMWHGGLMDGASNETFPGSHLCANKQGLPPYPFAYADNSASTSPANEVQPYFDIAKQFGFANYMFQTNQGPSFPAHQFLFSGTSAPVYNDSDPGQYWTWFASENPTGPGSASGCWGALASIVPQVTSVGTFPFAEYSTSGAWVPTEVTVAGGGSPPSAYPCYHHPSIAALLDNASPKITWRYYTNDKTSIWTAPTAIWDICQPNGAANTVPGTCMGADYTNNSVFQEQYSTSGGSAAQIYKDIQQCHLQQVSFVTPDGAWSDHAGCVAGTMCNTAAWGPAWVANLVNLVGQNPACPKLNNEVYWNDTVILITWDDWGGWYDHVIPPLHNGQFGYSNGSGYNNVYGFRVPLLVVSAYSSGGVPHNPPTQGYVSGPIGSNPNVCYGPPYCHDFGSILNFIEYVFGRGGSRLGSISSSITDPYADDLALDQPNAPNCNSTLARIPFLISSTSATRPTRSIRSRFPQPL